MTQINIKYFTVGQWQENAYCIYSNSESWILDPGDEFSVLKAGFDKQLTYCKGIINTHGHFDHIGAVHDFQEEYKIPFYIHSKDKRLVYQANLYRKLAGSEVLAKTPVIDSFIDEQKSYTLSDQFILVHHTPGHSEGSVCFEIGKNLISGDLFFCNAIGRVDLPGGNKEKIVKSLQYVFERFEGYDIYPGHGNPFLLDHNVISLLMKQF